MHNVIKDVPLPMLPEDTFSELRDMSPESYHFKESLEAFNELAHETGHRALTLADVFPPVVQMPPSGFQSEILIPAHQIDLAQFKGIIHSFAESSISKGSAVIPARLLTTDLNNEVILCDLRPHMTNSIRQSPFVDLAEQKRMDREVEKQTKLFADSKGTFQRPLTGVKGVGYARGGDTLLRSYFTVVDGAQGNGIRTMARVADSRDIPGQERLYRTVFHKTLKK